MLCHVIVIVWVLLLANPFVSFALKVEADPPPELEGHLQEIAKLAQPSPIIVIPEGWFLMGTIRKDDDPFGLETQYDDTEFPQRRIWLDTFSIDRDEVSMAEYLAFLHQHGLPVPHKLRHLIWHLIDVHVLPDYVMARWPAMFMDWEEAVRFCRVHKKRLPTEAEWEKAEGQREMYFLGAAKFQMRISRSRACTMFIKSHLLRRLTVLKKGEVPTVSVIWQVMCGSG